MLMRLAVSFEEAATQRLPLSRQSQIGLVTQDSGPFWFQQLVWRDARLMCCWSAACVGGMLSRALDLSAKSCFLASFISIVSLVRSYISTTERSDIESSLTSLGMRMSSSKA